MYNSITGSTGLGIFVLNLSGAALLQSRNNMLVRQVAMLVLNSTLTVEVLCDPIPPPIPKYVISSPTSTMVSGGC